MLENIRSPIGDEAIYELFKEDSRLGIVEENGFCVFPDGSAMGNCTNCASRVIQLVGCGEVWGYSSWDNPNTEAARGHDGHDFAIINNRVLVDIWLRFYAGSSERAVFDLTSNEDAADIKRLYGDRNSWQLVSRPWKKTMHMPS